jgi:hypothetical protein
MSALERGAWAACGTGAVLSAAGWFVAPHHLAYAWLAAFAGYVQWPIGALTLILVVAKTGGAWAEAAEPALLGGVAALLLLPLALVPLLWLGPVLYPWARPGAHIAQAFYLNRPFFAVRGVLYLVTWFGLGGMVLRCRSRRLSCAGLAGPGLVLLAVTVTFAAIDLTMSLEDFNSTIYGFLCWADAVLTTLALCLVAAAGTASTRQRATVARLTLGAAVLWMYAAFMQLLIVWQSDLASDAPWYVHRSGPFWGSALALVVVLRFVVPLSVLLFPACQRSRRATCLAALSILAGLLPDCWWTVLPAEPSLPGWFDLGPAMALWGGAVAIAGLAARHRLVARHV